MNEGINARFDKLLSEMKAMYNELDSIDDGSIEINEMKDHLENGLGAWCYGDRKRQAEKDWQDHLRENIFPNNT